MATVCGGTLALMDAGVPIKAPVAGIAMGLVKEGEKVVVLTDILGLETTSVIWTLKSRVRKMDNRIQMDTKIGGISREIMERALEQASRGGFYP